MEDRNKLNSDNKLKTAFTIDDTTDVEETPAQKKSIIATTNMEGDIIDVKDESQLPR